MLSTFSLTIVMEPKTESMNSTRCVLCKCIQDGGSVDDVRNILWQNIWEYMSPSKCCGDTLETRDHPWILAGCSLAGCRETMCFLMHTFVRHENDIMTSTRTSKQLINQKSSCDFPLPDSWVHKCVRLALSPLHLACWKLDFHMIQLLLRLGADPNDLALEKCEESFDPLDEQSYKSGIKGDKLSQVNCQNVDSLLFAQKESGDSCIPHMLPKTSLACHQITTEKNSTRKDKNLSGASVASSYYVDGSRNNSRIVTVDGEIFYPNKGLFPLDFIALGVRFPPMCSIELALRHNVIHDSNEISSGNMEFCDNLKSMCISRQCIICESFRSNDEGDVSCSSNEGFKDVKHNLLVKCLELLLSTGASPNQGIAKILGNCYPLDLLIQPPIEIYYEPMIGRSSQLSVNIRRYNLGNNISRVTSACRVMLSHNARLSPSFGSFYKWKPQYMDSFAIGCSTHAIELIKIITRLGLFPDLSTVSDNSPENRYKTNINGDSDLEKCIETFIAGVVNNQIPKELVLTIFRFVSTSTINIFCKIANRIVDSSEFAHLYLIDLAQSARNNQMRTLTHSSMLVILNSLNEDQRSIQTLPIPNALKRRLLFLDF